MSYIKETLTRGLMGLMLPPWFGLPPRNGLCSHSTHDDAVRAGLVGPAGSPRDPRKDPRESLGHPRGCLGFPRSSSG